MHVCVFEHMFSFSALTRLVGLHEWHLLQNLRDAGKYKWALGRYSQKYHTGTKSFSLSCKDVQDKDNWRQRINGEPANPGIPGIWLLKQRVYIFLNIQNS